MSPAPDGKKITFDKKPEENIRANKLQPKVGGTRLAQNEYHQNTVKETVQRVTPPTFDGTLQTSYLKYFEAVARTNDWIPKETDVALTVILRVEGVDVVKMKEHKKLRVTCETTRNAL